MAIVISSTNNKGGVGKTTTVVSLSTMLSRDHGKKVLVVDLDQQCNLSQAILGKSNFDGEVKNSGELFNLNSRFSVKELIVKSEYGVDIIPGRLDDLFLLEKELEVMYSKMKDSYIPLLKDFLETKDVNNVKEVISQMENDLAAKLDWKKILRKRLSEISNEYDYIFIDLPPSISRVPKNAWVASDFLLIPISDYFALNGTEGLISEMVGIKREDNEKLKFIFLFNKAPMTSNMWRKDSINKEYLKIVDSFTKAIQENSFLSQMSYIMETKVRNSPDFEKLYGRGLTMVDVAEGKILDDYTSLTEEFIQITQ